MMDQVWFVAIWLFLAVGAVPVGRTVLPSASAAGALIERLADGKTVRPTITCVKQISHLEKLPC